MGSRVASSAGIETSKPHKVDWRRRLLTAAVAIPTICLVVLSHEMASLIAVITAITIGYREFSQLVKYDLKINYFIFAFLCWSGSEPAIVFLATVLNVFIPLWSHGPHEGVRTGLLNVFFVHFFAVPFSYPMRLRRLGFHGASLTLMWIIVSFASDAGALIVGNRFGKTPCCPAISPKKSWEGIFGAVAFGTITSVAITMSGLLGSPDMHVLDGAVLGILASVFGMLGDLIESGFKRFVDVKDASSLLPGHGGLLDRLDALAASVPVWFFYCQYRAF